MTRKLLAEFVILGTVANPSLMFAGSAGSILLRRLVGVSKSTTELEMAGGRPAHYALRLSNAQAAIGLSQLKNLESNLSHRRAAAQFYAEELAPYRAPIWFSASSSPAFVRYPVRVSNKQLVVRKARKQAVEIGVWFTSPIHPAGSSLEAAAYRPGSCPRAEVAVAHTVNLPTHPKTTVDDMERAFKAVQPWLAED
jgi:dTDP-4-amino-4,6-dideoxygalactose transaminase